MLHQPIPVAPTAVCFAHRLDRARAELVALVRDAKALKDPEFAKEAQHLLDDFDASAVACHELIAEANRRAA